MRLWKSLVFLLIFCLGGCGAYLYDQPKIFGIYDFIWWNLSQRQREFISENLTSPTTHSVNREKFAHCVNTCVPHNDSGSTGVAEKCFNKCLKKITPVPKGYISSIPF